jgi:hypothetical protein
LNGSSREDGAPHLDAKLTSWNFRDKKIASAPMTFVKKAEYESLKVSVVMIIMIIDVIVMIAVVKAVVIIITTTIIIIIIIIVLKLAVMGVAGGEAELRADLRAGQVQVHGLRRGPLRRLPLLLPHAHGRAHPQGPQIVKSSHFRVIIVLHSGVSHSLWIYTVYAYTSYASPPAATPSSCAWAHSSSRYDDVAIDKGFVNRASQIDTSSPVRKALKTLSSLFPGTFGFTTPEPSRVSAAGGLGVRGVGYMVLPAASLPVATIPGSLHLHPLPSKI